MEPWLFEDPAGMMDAHMHQALVEQGHQCSAAYAPMRLLLCRREIVPPAEFWCEVHVHGLPYEGDHPHQSLKPHDVTLPDSITAVIRALTAVTSANQPLMLTQLSQNAWSLRDDWPLAAV